VCGGLPIYEGCGRRDLFDDLPFISMRYGKLAYACIMKDMQNRAENDQKGKG